MNMEKETHEIIKKYYLKFLARVPTQSEIDSQILWMKKNNVQLGQLPFFIKKSNEYLEKHKSKIFSKNNIIKIHKDGFTFFMDNNDTTSVQIFSQKESYEEGTGKILKRLLKKNMNVINIGANIGYFTVIIAKLVEPLGKVFALEPLPTTVYLLKKNILANNCTNVKAFSKAISNFSGKADLCIAPSNVHNFIAKNGKPSYKKIKVETITIDDFVQQQNSHIDFIMMDAEGSEKYAFEGMIKTLENNPKLQIISEYNPFTFELAGTSGKDFVDLCEKLQLDTYLINEKNGTTTLISKEKLLKIQYPNYVNLYLKKN